MSNVIQIKRGAGKPVNGTLAPYELGYDVTDSHLYIGGAMSESGYGETKGIKVDFAMNSESADQLTTARSIQINLASTSSANFNGSENIAPGVTGVLSIANGGLGVDASTDAGKTTARANLGISLSNLGITATAAELNKLDGVTATTAELNILDGITASTAELNYCDGVTSNIQTQLNGKQATITGGITTAISNNFSANVVVVSNSAGKINSSSITTTELGYLDGVTSNIQTQLNSKISNFTLLASGKTLNTSNTSFTISSAKNYKGFIFFGLTQGSNTEASAEGYSSITIPSAMLGTTAKKFVITDGTNSKIFSVAISSSGTMTVTNVGYQAGGVAEGSVYVYGLK